MAQVSKTQMSQEALEAPDRVGELVRSDAFSALAEKLRARPPAFVTTIARGSSDHAATYASYLIPQCTGCVVASLPPSLTSVYKARLQLKDQFVLAISQSGGSPDIVSSLKGARESGALTAALVNNTSSPLADAAEIVLSQGAGPEKSITATKSVLCTLTAIAKLTAEWSGDKALGRGLEELPEVLRAVAEQSAKLSDQILTGVGSSYILARGFGLSAALEIALKFKETCGVHAEAFSTAEVLHGPREIVDKDFFVLALALPGPGYEDILKAAQEMKAQGARVLVIGSREKPDADAGFVLPPISDSRLMPIVVLQALYPWLSRQSLALGLHPDNPKTLKSKVIQTV